MTVPGRNPYLISPFAKGEIMRGQFAQNNNDATQRWRETQFSPLSLSLVQSVDKTLSVQFFDNSGVDEVRRVGLAGIGSLRPIKNGLDTFSGWIRFFREHLDVKLIGLPQLLGVLHFHILFQDRRRLDFFGLVKMNSFDH